MKLPPTTTNDPDPEITPAEDPPFTISAVPLRATVEPAVPLRFVIFVDPPSVSVPPVTLAIALLLPAKFMEPPEIVPVIATEPVRFVTPPVTLETFSTPDPAPIRLPPLKFAIVRSFPKVVTPVPERVPIVTVPELAIKPRLPEFTTDARATLANEKLAVPPEFIDKLLIAFAITEVTDRLPPLRTPYVPVYPIKVPPSATVPFAVRTPAPVSVPANVPALTVKEPLLMIDPAVKVLAVAVAGEFSTRVPPFTVPRVLPVPFRISDPPLSPVDNVATFPTVTEPPVI